MTILVTGGCGYIGSHMVHALADAGENVVVLDDLSTGFRAALPAGVPLYVGNVGDESLVCAILGAHTVRAIIHFAAAIVVPDSVRDPLFYYRNNTMNTRALLECAVKSEVRHFIFSSTAAVYGSPETTSVGEDAPTRPLSPYGASKLMSEMMLRDVAAAHDLKYVILRYFNVAGADPQLRTGQMTAAATHLIKVAIETALGLRARLDIFGTDYPTPDGTCIRDYIHVSDLVRAHLMALAYLRRGGASLILNCGYGHGYSVREVIAAVKRVSGRNFAIRESERRAGDPAVVVADAGNIRNLLGWHPDFDNLDTIIADMLSWESKQARQ